MTIDGMGGHPPDFGENGMNPATRTIQDHSLHTYSNKQQPREKSPRLTKKVKEVFNLIWNVNIYGSLNPRDPGIPRSCCFIDVESRVKHGVFRNATSCLSILDLVFRVGAGHPAFWKALGVDVTLVSGLGSGSVSTGRKSVEDDAITLEGK